MEAQNSLLIFLSYEICVSYLVHVWFDAAYKEGVGGTKCGHQGMQRVLEHVESKMIKIRKGDKVAVYSKDRLLYL